MPRPTINLKLVPLGLNDVDTNGFERFGQAFYAAVMGRVFVPLGGMHDGGAEGYIEPELFEDPQAIHFLQVSKQTTYRTKICATVKRLRDYGRKPQSVVYLTSQTIQDIDIVEEELSEQLRCRILIRDAKYIEAHINRNEETVAAFTTHLRPHLEYLFEPGNVNIAPRTAHYTDRTLAVFLRQEVEHRRGQTDLLDTVSDSLILWSLSDTDPDQGKLMNRQQILEKIEQALPSARRYIRGVLDSRLDNLRRKDRTDGRQVRHYNRDGGLYCLPFETRELVAAENLEDVSLKEAVTVILTQRCKQLLEDEEDLIVPQVVSVCHDVLQRLFERQGLQVALFVTDGDQDDEIYANAAALIVEVIEANRSFSGVGEAIRRLSTRVLRGTFYDGTESLNEKDS